METKDKFDSKHIILDVNEKAQIMGFKAYCKAKDLQHQTSKTPQRQEGVRKLYYNIGVYYFEL